MSIVIACKFKNGILFESDRQVTYNGNRSENQVNKIMKVEDQPLVIGGVGLLRELQQLFYISKDWFSDFNGKDLSTNTCITYINRLTNLFREKQFICENQIIDHLQGSFILADPYNINVISQDLSVLSNFDYYAIGCGSDLVMGHLNVLFSEKDPKEMSKTEIDKILSDCINIACKDDIAIDNNLDKIALYKRSNDLVEDDAYEIINKCEYDILDKSKPKNECHKNCTGCLHNLKFIYSKKDKTIRTVSN